MGRDRTFVPRRRIWITPVLFLALTSLALERTEASPTQSTASTAVATWKFDRQLQQHNLVDNGRRASWWENKKRKGGGKGGMKPSSKGKTAKSTKSEKEDKRTKSAKSSRSQKMRLTIKPTPMPTDKEVKRNKSSKSSRSQTMKLTIKPTPFIHQPVTPRPTNTKPVPTPKPHPTKEPTPPREVPTQEPAPSQLPTASQAVPSQAPTATHAVPTQSPTATHAVPTQSPTASLTAPSLQPTMLKDVACFSNPSEARALGTIVLSAFQSRLANSNCNPATLEGIMNDFFRDDVIVQFSNGTIGYNGIDQVKNYFIGTDAQPGPFRGACFQPLSWTTKGLFLHPAVLNEMVLAVNEEHGYFGNPTDERGRYFIMELFSGTVPLLSDGDASSQPAAPPLKPQCRSPQIYTIVFQPTFQ